jgi:hypothetical protein
MEVRQTQCAQRSGGYRLLSFTDHIEKAAGEPAAFPYFCSRPKLLLLLFGCSGFFGSFFSLLGGVGRLLGGVSSIVGSAHGASGGSGVSRSRGGIGSGGGGVGGSLGSVSANGVGSGHVGSSLGFGRSCSSFGSGVFSLLLVGASGQGEAQSQGDQRLVESHDSFPRRLLGNALLRADNMMTSQ